MVPILWRLPLFLWAVLAAVLLLTQWQAASSMAQLWWRSDTFAHGMLVPLISLWLVWRQRFALGSIAPKPCWLGLPVLLAALAVGHAGWLAEVNVLQHFGVVLTLQAVTLMLLGWPVARQIGFALLFLLFAPPFGEFMTEPMMVWTADFVVQALQFTGVPVYREGLHFVIPSGQWSVVEACSGVRYLMASFMVGTLFAHLNYTRWSRRLGFMAFSIAVPILANWLRAYLIVMIGHLSDNRLATGADHLVYGWVFFGLIMMAMFWVGARWADAAPAATVPVLESSGKAPAGLRAAHWVAVAAVMALIQGGVAQWVYGLRPAQPPAINSPHFSALSPPPAWTDHTHRQEGWAPVFVGASAELRTAWQREGEPPVQLDMAFYPAQRAEAKAVSSTNVLVRSKDASWVMHGTSLVEGAGGSARQWHWERVASGASESQRYLARRLYWIDGRFVGSERQAKLGALRQLLAGRGEAAAVVVLLTRDAQDAQARLSALQADLLSPMNAHLRQLAGEHNPRP